MRNVKIVVCCVMLTVAAAAIGLYGPGTAKGATSVCSLSVPSVWTGDEQGEVYTGHVKGSCTFKWHSENQIMYKDRWHVLGTNWHGPYAANTYVVESADVETYAPDCGSWKLRVLVFDTNGNQRYAANGPVTYFCS